MAAAAHPNSLANLRPWTAADRARRGHPKRVTLLQYMRDHARGSQARADFMLRVLRGEPCLDPAMMRSRRYPSLRLRMQAAEWLTTRAFGRHPASLALTDDARARPMLLAHLSPEDQAALQAIFRRALRPSDRVT